MHRIIDGFGGFDILMLEDERLVFDLVFTLVSRARWVDAILVLECSKGRGRGYAGNDEGTSKAALLWSVLSMV